LDTSNINIMGAQRVYKRVGYFSILNHWYDYNNASTW